MSTRLRSCLGTLVLALSLLLPDQASAARVLFVSDHGTDLSIADVLMGDGHDVTTVNSDFFTGLNPTFHASLAMYDCIVWSATNDESFSPHTDTLAFNNLHDFVSNGGNVFVTGYGSVGYGDTRLVAFLGGTSGSSFTGGPLAVANLDTDLTTGVVDLRGITPANLGFSEYEAITGLGTDTISIAGAMFAPDASQWAIRSVGEGHIAWVAGSNGSDSEWALVDSGPNGAFNGALRNFVTASTGTASVPGAPRIAFSAPFTASEGDPITITVHVTDAEGDSVTWSWDLDGDGTYGDMMGADMVTIPAGTTDGPGNYQVGVEASDGIHVSHRSRSISIANVAPRVTSRPPTTAAIDQHVRYALTVLDPGGSHDPQTFTLRTGPETAIVTADGVFDWMPTEAEITAAGVMRPVAIDVDDGDMGTTTQMWSMTVIDDHAPSDPSMLYPAIDAPILIAGAHLAIGNSSDLDGDPVTYTFDLDSAPTFDSPDLQSSGSQAGVATGITEWMPDESGLHVGRWYWRVTASDGHVSTSPMVAAFLFVPDPTMFPDVGPLGDASGADAGPVVSAPRGCSCRASAPRSVPGSLAGLTLIGLAIVAGRRRR